MTPAVVAHHRRTIMGLFSAAMPIGDFFLFWLPLYHELKLGFAIFLWYPGRRWLDVFPFEWGVSMTAD